MNTPFCFVIVRRLVLIAMTVSALRSFATDPRLLVEQGRIFDGFVADLVPRADGAIIVSGDYSPPLAPHQGEPRAPHIAVLDPAGNILRRLSPPSLSSSTNPVQQALGPFVRWRVKAVLTNGWYIVDDDSRFLPRLVLDGDGTPKQISAEWSPFPNGPVVVESNGAVLIGRSPADLGFGTIGRWKLFVDRSNDGSLTWDWAFGSNVFKALPVQDLSCARMATTRDGRIWAWLGRPDEGARLFRFLPDGRPDPSFNPPTPIRSSMVDDPFFEIRQYGITSRASWLGPLPDGGVLILADNPDGPTSTVLRRLREDGVTDLALELDSYNDLDRPIMTLPDGSLFVQRQRDNDGPLEPVEPLLKFTSDGHRDAIWRTDFPSEVAGGEISKIIQQLGGDLIVLIHSGERLRSSKLLKLRADGSLGTSFDASAISPTPVPVVRLMATGLQPGHTYTVTESSDEGLVAIPSAGIDYNPQAYTFRGHTGKTAMLREIQLGPAISQLFWLLRESD